MKEVAKLRREREKVEIKQRILNSALHLARTEGWQNVSIRKIATLIEYTTPVVYEHFESKEQILTALSSEGFVKFQVLCEQVTAKAKSASKALEGISLAMLHFANDSPQYYQVMFNLEGVVCKNEKFINAAFIKEIIGQLTTSRKTDLLFLNWWSIVHGFVNISQVDLKELDIQIREKMLKEFIQRFMDSI